MDEPGTHKRGQHGSGRRKPLGERTEAGIRSRLQLPNNRMQQTAPRVGRADNGLDAAAACSLTLAPAPLLMRVFYGPRKDRR